MSQEVFNEVSAPETDGPKFPKPTQPAGSLMWVVVVFGIILLLCGQFWGVRPGSKGSKAGVEENSKSNSDTQTHLPPGGYSQE